MEQFVFTFSHRYPDSGTTLFCHIGLQCLCFVFVWTRFSGGSHCYQQPTNQSQASAQRITAIFVIWYDIWSCLHICSSHDYQTSLLNCVILYILSAHEDDVRAPIPQKREVLVEQDTYIASHKRRRKNNPTSVFDKFRDFQAEASTLPAIC
mgnify:FL=1